MWTKKKQRVKYSFKRVLTAAEVATSDILMTLWIDLLLFQVIRNISNDLEPESVQILNIKIWKSSKWFNLVEISSQLRRLKISVDFSQTTKVSLYRRDR
jgi:hypothetical protein